MAVSINQIQRPQENKESDLDKLAKLVGIGTNIYGAYDTFKQAPGREADAALKVSQAEAMKRRQAGQANDADLLEYSKEYDISDVAPKDMTGVQKLSYVGQPSGLPPVNPQDGMPLPETVRYLTLKKDKSLPYMIEKLKSDAALNYANAEKARRENDPNNPKKAWDLLPPENQKQIEKLAGNMADTSKVRSIIDAGVAQLSDPNIPDEQKIIIGKELLKPINSLLGSDATGAEEVKRLGALLEFKLFNATEPGSFIGRDLGMFTDQVKNNLKRVDAVQRDAQGQIANLRTGQPFQVAPNPTQAGLPKNNFPNVKVIPEAQAASAHPQDTQAVQWAKQNPNDPRALKILQMNGAR
jgi:hypothetical protein